MRRAPLALVLSLSLGLPATALVGGAPEVPDPANQPEVMLVGVVGERSNFCTGTAIARDLVLTAAHCVLPGAVYKLLSFTANKTPVLKDTTLVVHHPQFDLKTMLAHRATADVALLKLAAPLNVQPATLLPPRQRVAPGERFVLRGYGFAVRGDGSSAGTLRYAALIATGQPGNLQLRLVDPATGGTRAGFGACTGDSGAPVYVEATNKLAIYGLVSWSTGPGGDSGCGGLTGVTPLDLYRGWIEQQAKRMESALSP